MKKVLIISILFIAFATVVNADNSTIKITYNKRSHNSTDSPIGRLPMNLPVEVVLDEVNGVLSVSSPEDIEGCVYVYDLSGIQEAYSPELNTTVTLPRTEDVHIISLQGTNWYGEGKIVY